MRHNYAQLDKLTFQGRADAVWASADHCSLYRGNSQHLKQRWTCVCVCFKESRGKPQHHKHFLGCSSFGNIGLKTWRLCCFDVKLEVDVLALTPLHQFLPLNFLVWKQRPRCPLTHGLWSFYLHPDIYRWQTAIPVKVHPNIYIYILFFF